MYTVGIITYHHYYNYGTMLQALALQQVIEKLGYDAEIIDFKQNNQLPKNSLVLLRIRRMGVYINEFNKYWNLHTAHKRVEERSKAFEKFYKKYLKIGKQQYSSSDELKKNPPIYDAYLVGSDQTWNPNVGNNPEAFYLHFVADKNKCGSYAPSVGLSYLSDEQKLYMKKNLSHIKYLSCRENRGAKLLEDITDRRVTTVLDPTLLLDATMWLEYATIPQNLPQKYILQYFLGDSKECRKFVNELSRKTGLPVIILAHSYLDVNKDNSVYCAPDVFLGLIRHAEFVCTDSFHGTAFSLNFGRNFFSFHKRKEQEEGSDNSRITDLIERFNLQERLIRDGEVPGNLEIDYRYVNQKLKEEKKISMEYLTTMLKGMQEND